MSEWKSIETAPKDGTHVLVIRKEWWEPENGDNRWIYTAIRESYWLVNHSEFAMGDARQPTHWMPMPSMPA